MSGSVSAFLVDLTVIDEAIAGATAPRRPGRGSREDGPAPLLGSPRWLVDFVERWDAGLEEGSGEPPTVQALQLVPNLVVAALHDEDLRSWPDDERRLSVALLRAACVELGEDLPGPRWAGCTREDALALVAALERSQASVPLPTFVGRGAGRWPCASDMGVEECSAGNSVRWLASTGGLHLPETEQALLDELRAWWRDSAMKRRALVVFWRD